MYSTVSWIQHSPSSMLKDTVHLYYSTNTQTLYICTTSTNTQTLYICTTSTNKYSTVLQWTIKLASLYLRISKIVLLAFYLQLPWGYNNSLFSMETNVMHQIQYLTTRYLKKNPKKQMQFHIHVTHLNSQLNYNSINKTSTSQILYIHLGNEFRFKKYLRV